MRVPFADAKVNETKALQAAPVRLLTIRKGKDRAGRLGNGTPFHKACMEIRAQKKEPVSAPFSPAHPGFVFLNLAYFLAFSNVAFFYLYPLALDAMGAGSRTIGWVMGVFSLIAVLSRPFMGRIGGRHGEFRLMSAGMVVMLAATACYPFLERVGPILLSVRGVHGLGFSAFVAGSFSAVARLFSEERRAQAYGIVGASLMAAVALAPLLGELLLGRWGFDALYGAACGVVALGWIAVRKAARRAGEGVMRRAERRVVYRPFLRDVSFLFLLLSTVIFGHCQSTVFNFLALWAEETDASAGGFFFVAFTLAIGILLTSGRAIDRWGKRRFLRLSYPVFGSGLLLIPPLFGCFGGWIPALLFGAGMGFLFPAHNALAAEHGGASGKAGAMALFTAVYDSGFITGPVLSGAVASWIGLERLFTITGGTALLGFIVCLAAPIRERQDRSKAFSEGMRHG